MKDGAGGNGDAEHLFETKSLGAELNVVVVPLSAFTAFVFDGKRLGPKLHKVGDADDSWVYDDLSFTPDGGGTAVVAASPNSAPEPGSLVLLGMGGFGLAGWRWRTRKR